MQDGLILVVEDDLVLQSVMKMALSHLGYQCVVVGSGEDAVTRHASDICLIFLDIGLPGIQGDQTALLLREKELKERRRRVPIVALTGHANRQECLSAGIDDHMFKPALLKDLLSMIQKYTRDGCA